MTGTFRKSYRKLTDAEERRVALIKDQAEVLLATLESLPGCREQSLAITRLEECVMWAVKATT